MSAPSIILSHPQLGENIGAAARAMKNFGLADLRLIAPKTSWPNDKARAMAVGAVDLIDTAPIAPDTRSALADLQLVLATTARTRGVPKETLTPAEGIRRLREAAARGIKCGILFGNERAGLENDEVSLCDAVISIPTTEFSSLNLGQAVLVCCYEWFKAGDVTPAAHLDQHPLQRPPTRDELFGLFDHLERELTTSGFLYPPDKREHMVRAIRAMLHRAHLTYQEVQTVRGMIVAMARGKHRRPKAERAAEKAAARAGVATETKTEE
ncbi:MAG: RNA methyltransferase [Rhizomicrobium sp.]